MIKDTYSISDIEDKLRQRGYKVTPQRVEIIRILYENKKLMKIEEIFSEAKSNTLGISTIYRNLIILEQAAIIKKINIDNINYYELENDDEYRLHIHAVCLNCNHIIDIDDNQILDKFSELIKKINMKEIESVKSTCIILKCICSKCE